MVASSEFPPQNHQLVKPINVSIFLLLVASTLSGCVIVQSHAGYCKYPGGGKALVQRKLALIAAMTPPNPSDRLTFGSDRNPVFVAVPEGKDPRNTPPVLLLHEMPGLSPEVLELARSISDQGYTVYVPLLMGKPDENTDSDALFFRRANSIRFSDPLWESRFQPAAGGHPATRQAGVVELAKLATAILARHSHHRMGVIGNSFSGHLAMALAARMEEVAAPVTSQPAYPFSLVTTSDVGLTGDEIAALRKRVAGGYQILGFRYEYDHICPRERFIQLRKYFGTHGFLDRTLMGDRYQRTDGLPHGAHSVLALCYQPWTDPRKAEPVTHYAFRQLLAFLDAKLKDLAEYRDPPEILKPDDLPQNRERGRFILARSMPKVITVGRILDQN